MNAPLPVDLLPAQSACPACGTSLVLDPRRPTPCPSCSAVIGSPRRFVDDAGHRLAVRPAFSSGPPRACNRCRQTLQRVLVDDVAGCFCGACNLVFIGARQAPRLVPLVGLERLQVDTDERGWHLKTRDVAAVALAALAIATVACVELGVFLS